MALLFRRRCSRLRAATTPALCVGLSVCLAVCLAVCLGAAPARAFSDARAFTAAPGSAPVPPGFAPALSFALPGPGLLFADGLFSGPSLPDQFRTASPYERMLALGGRDQEALEPRGANGGSGLEAYLGGSFIGALLFGYPFKGVGLADMALLALLALIVMRAMALRRRQGGDDAFNADAHNRNTRENGREDAPDERAGPGAGPWPGQPGNGPDASGRRDGTGGTDGTGNTGDPRDNAWSRRLRGEPGISLDKTRPRAPEPPSRWSGDAGNAGPNAPDDGKTPRQRRAEAMWAHLSSKQAGAPAAGSAPAAADPGAVAQGVQVPADFDVADFLEGARALYARLQKSWAARKVDDLAPFATEDMLALLREQAVANPEPETAEVLLVHAVLQGFSRRDQDEEALVRFDATLRLGQNGQPTDTTELWRFSRGPSSQGMWRLAGIEEA